MMAPDTGEHLASDGSAQTPGTAKRKRGPRAAVACDTCRTRKVKCDGGYPCSNCVQHAFSCSYKEREQVVRLPLDSGTATHATAAPSGSRLAPRRDDPQPHRLVAPPSTSPINLGGALESDHPSAETPMNSFDRGLDSVAALSDQDPGGLGQINEHTEGAEFYGPSGTFYFLSKLRSQADSHRKSASPLNADQDVMERSPAETTVVNLLHSSDYSASADARDRGQHVVNRRFSRGSPRDAPSSRELYISRSRPDHLPIDTEIERECVRLYFQNQHCIHPILDQAAFVAHCDKEVWGESPLLDKAASPQIRSHTRFLALFNIVVAIGAVNAGETSILLTWDRTFKFLDQAETLRYDGSPYPPIRVARLFFERAKSHLEDVFESTSLETAQTLFLMSVFCQDALKPHACYMYSGMAVRTASAIGIPTTQSSSNQERLLWWALYSHETEMCSSAGRQSFLKEPSHYQIPLPSTSASRGPSLHMVTCMVELARILSMISQNVRQPGSVYGVEEMSQQATNLEGMLSEWKARLPHQLDFESLSLEESELVTKQKIVLKLRYLNARILLHRPFLITRAGLTQDTLSRHAVLCVEAARETIEFMHTTYLHRPYFRTWWYNCTYVLDASMVLLYAILSSICPFRDESIFGSVEKSLEIFKVMRTVAVVRRCADITQDVLNVARRSQGARQRQAGELPRLAPAVAPDGGTTVDQLVNPISDGTYTGEAGGNIDLIQEEPYANLLVDTNLVYNLLNFEDWNAWTDIGYG